MIEQQKKTATQSEINRYMEKRRRTSIYWAVGTGILAYFLLGILFGIITGVITWYFNYKTDNKEEQRIYREHDVIKNY